MKNKKNLNSVDLTKVVDADEPSTSTIRVSLFDHLTPNQAKLLQQAKAFQKVNNYSYCWTKNQEILLKEKPSSRVKIIKSPKDLQVLKTNILSSTLDNEDDNNIMNGPQSLPPPMQSMQGQRGSWRGQPRGRWVTNNSRGGARTGPNTRARSSQNSKKN